MHSLSFYYLLWKTETQFDLKEMFVSIFYWSWLQLFIKWWSTDGEECCNWAYIQMAGVDKHTYSILKSWFRYLNHSGAAMLHRFWRRYLICINDLVNWAILNHRRHHVQKMALSTGTLHSYFIFEPVIKVKLNPEKVCTIS